VKKLAVGLLGLLLVLAACVPTQKPVPPQARVEGFQLISVDPFADEARFALRLRVSNPNAFELPMLESRLTLHFGAASLPFDLPAVTLPPSGFEIVDAELRVPLGATAQEVGHLLSGEPVRLRITGTVKASLGPVPLSLGPMTLLDEDVRVDLRFATPRFEIVPERSRLTLSGSVVEVVVGFQALNPNPVGFYLRGPFQLVVGGRSVAETSLDLPLRPRQAGAGELRFRVNLTEIPGAAAALVTGLPVELRGGLKAEVPGVWSQLLDVFFGGRVR